MTYQGHVENGTVVLDETVKLPNGAKVVVAVFDTLQRPEAEEPLPTLYERLKPVIGIVEGPADLAENHDHYAHGRPKT